MIENKPRGIELTEDDYPSLSARADGAPIDQLKPGSEVHQRVLDYLLKRLDASEREMRNFYARWRVNEKKYQAYIDLPDWEQTIKDMNDQGSPPIAVPLIIPYSYATISTIVTFILHSFTGKRPYFTVGSYKDELVENAQNMELKLQYDLEHVRFAREMHQFAQDVAIYGLGVFQTGWMIQQRKITVRAQEPQVSIFGMGLGNKAVRRKEMRTVYEGNSLHTIDPFMFFPDPRVPMNKVNESGEFAFWRSYEGRHLLKRDEQAGIIKYLDYASEAIPESRRGGGTGESARAILTGGDSVPGLTYRVDGKSNIQVDQGICEIIPRELGIGSSDQVEKWIFTILNKSQIVQAQPAGADHDTFGLAVAEPDGLGHGFGAVSVADMIGPIQDAITWLFNSHIDNVRRTLNDMWIIDPSMVEVSDLKKAGPGKIIRLKPSAHGLDVRQAVQQLAVQDVTQQHVGDMEVLLRIGQLLSGVSENVMGVQNMQGRRSATEVRSSNQAASSRLASRVKLISAHAIQDLAVMMSVNNQQWLSDEFQIQLLGKDGAMHQINPGNLAGDFHYPVHDGTLPDDKIALLDVWKEIFIAVQSDQELRQSHSIPKIFEFIAELGGAQNIEQFRAAGQQPGLQASIVPDEVAAQAQQNGNAVPLPNAPRPGGTNTINAAPGRPANRLAGALG